MISIRGKRFIKLSPHPGKFVNRKEKIRIIFSKCFSKFEECIIHKRQFDMFVLWKMQIRILPGVLVLYSLDKFWRYYFSPLNEFLKVDFLLSSEADIPQGQELRNLYDNEWKSLYEFYGNFIINYFFYLILRIKFCIISRSYTVKWNY